MSSSATKKPPSPSARGRRGQGSSGARAHASGRSRGPAPGERRSRKTRTGGDHSKTPRKATGKAKKPARKRSRRRLLLVLGVLLLAGLGAALGLAKPFWELTAQFGSYPTKQPSRLYGQALEIRVGQSLGAEDLVTLLEDRGYSAVEGTTSPGTYRRSGAVVEVFRRVFTTSRGRAGGD